MIILSWSLYTVIFTATMVFVVCGLLFIFIKCITQSLVSELIREAMK